jgi:hypothetical protein
MASNRGNAGGGQHGSTGSSSDRPRDDQGQFESTRDSSQSGSTSQGGQRSGNQSGNPGQPRNSQGEFESTTDSGTSSGSEQKGSNR